MPEKDFDPAATTFYLDQSTLSDAYRAAIDPSQPREFLQLRQEIEQATSTGNLALSFVHVGETSDWEDGWEGFSAWIDGMPFAWALTLEVEPTEVEAAIKVALGVQPSGRFRPFGRRGRSMREMVAVARQQGWEPLKRLPFVQTDAVRADLEFVRQAGISDADLAAKRDYNMRVAIRELARDAHVRMMLREDPEYLPVQIGQAVQDKLVELFERDPTVLRTLRMSYAGIEALTANAVARTPGSKKELGQLEGFAGDHVHATYGAAWADVFTCDGPTSRWVTPVRRQFGLSAPIVRKGHPGGDAGFVGDLVAALKALSASRPASNRC